MFGFPLSLYNSGASPVKMTQDADSGFPKPWTREIFYSIKDGNWTDTNVWNTASGRVGLLPTTNDDVYIRHTVTLTANVNSNNLFIASYATLRHDGTSSTTRVINVFGNLTSSGNITASNGIGAGISFVLYGTSNSLDSYSVQTSLFSITYARIGDQDIMPIVHDKLFTSNGGIKYAKSDLTVTTSIYATQGTTIELGQYNLDCGTLGDGSSAYDGIFSKQGYGTILFRGAIAPRTTSSFILDGNPLVECRGGISSPSALSFATFRSGTGTWTFTTNNQSVASTNLSFSCPILIDSGITLTIGGTYGTTITLNDTINGVSGTSKLLMGGATAPILNFATLASVSSMTTGIWDFTTNANTIQYNGNYSATIPSYFTTFSSLTIAGTGTKTLGVNTTVNAALSIAAGTFELSSYNLTVGGTTTCNAGTLSKNAAGNVIFIGNVSTTLLDFSGGNPSVEVRNGIIYNGNSFTFNTGTGTWTFTTNNQSLVRATSISGTITFNGNILISGAITLTLDTQTSGQLILQANSLNGDNAGSKLVNKQTLYLINSSYPVPMTTGTLDISSFANTVGYVFNGNYTLPYLTYSGLTISGTGTKTLSGNTTLSGGLSVAAGTLELSTYNLSVTGTSNIASTLSKSGAGNVLFIGNTAVSGTINFSSGNPIIEFRNGVASNSNSPTSSFGTGLITFSTNNQSISNGVSPFTGFTFNNNILISGAITVQTAKTGSGGYNGIFNGYINGDNVASKFLMGVDVPTINYRSATQPMATGILDTSTNLNTWVYGNSNQDIKGNLSILTKQVYRNLTLNGGGTKTLLGFVSVLNTYTLTPPATVLLNGFTITNP